jgi:hypothetical protein
MKSSCEGPGAFCPGVFLFHIQAGEVEETVDFEAAIKFEVLAEVSLKLRE